MKRMFKGFSLTEVLITLAMIGIIASMTLPALQLNIQKQEVGPALAKAVNTLQTSARVLLDQTGTRTLEQACAQFDVGAGGFPYCLMKSGVAMYNEEPDLRTFTKGTANTAVSMGKCVIAGDGISLCPSGGAISGTSPKADTLDKRYHGGFYILYVDTNGPKKPDTIGKDVFQIYVDYRGIVIPYGSQAWKDYTGEEESWKENCNKVEVQDADYCAGAISDNSWQVKYAF